ncbi:uncharacterized protein LOC134239363 [Saccostrea cucullata]|uniref:uncharacterized protein LOC134239363 n=1 Tax=Saccostrea cuccullata TaxID=36930 RepID=UPI002ED5966B
MNSNLFTDPKKFCLHVLTYFAVLLLLVSQGTTAPVNSQSRRFVGITPVQGQKDVTQKKMFLRTKSHRALEILSDGTVRGTACGHNTQYSLLQSGSHNLGNTVFGIAAQRFLCVAPDGIIYSLPKDDFKEEDCVFNETIDYKETGNRSNPGVLEYSKYRHKKHGIRVGNSVRRYQLALVCNKAVTISMRKDRKKYVNETLFLVERTDLELRSLQENCSRPSNSDLSCKKRESDKKDCSEKVKKKGAKRSYVKFCRKVMKNFFSASLRKLRLFRKRDCYSVLSEYYTCRRKKRQNNKGPS